MLCRLFLVSFRCLLGVSPHSDRLVIKPRSHIHVRGYGPRGLITDREVTDETCSSSPVLAGKHVPTVRVRKTRAVGGFDQGNSGLYHGLPWRHR